MPFVYIFCAILLGYIVYGLYLLVMIIIWPVFFGWLAYILYKVIFIKDIFNEFRTRFVELIELDHAPGELAFRMRNDPSKVMADDSDTTLLAAVIVAVAYYLFYAYEIFLEKLQDDGLLLLLASLGAFLLTAAGLYAAIRYTREILYVHVAHGAVRLRVASLNAQAARFGDFSIEAELNDALRKSFQANPKVADVGLLNAIQSNLDAIVSGDQSLQAIIDAHTAALRIENRKLGDLSGKYASLQGTYDFACRRANHVGNEAVFRYLDLIAKEGIAVLVELINQSRWDEFSQHIDGAQEELKNLLENIEQLESGEDASSGVEIEENNDDPYAVLGVRADLSNDEIRKVYRLLANIYHPDRGNVSDHRKFQQIQQAWAAICKVRNIR